MNKIRILPPEIAERIAAGEVIERPSSVVKELVENSIDAKATEVAVYLEAGGKDLIEILDNGSGMAPEDLQIAVQRHATSKLQALSDLEKIHTLGFRGEALPSVAAVSDLSILSRAQGQPTCYLMELGDLPGSGEKPHPETFGNFIGTDHGTRIQARNLFSKIPARLKFLKSNAAEVSAVREWMERLALSHSQIGFSLKSDGRDIVKLRPSTDKQRVLQVLADGENLPVIERHSIESFGKISLYWVQGYSLPQARKMVQVVNGRAVRDRLLQQAIMSAFRQHLLPGQFPAILVRLEIDPILLDVNIHPTKTEVRFLDSRKIFHSIDKAIESMILSVGSPVFLSDRTPLSTEKNSHWEAREYTPQNSPIQDSLNYRSESGFSSSTNSGLSYSNPSYAPSSTANSLSGEILSETAYPSLSDQISQSTSMNVLGRFVGIFFSTYIAFEQNGELVLLDQHAAHERVRYEKLKQRALDPERQSPPQQLLIPEVIKIDPIQRPVFEEKLELLSRLGFDAEIFGEDSVLFRSVPPEWGNKSLLVRLKSLLERLETADASLVDENLFEKLASEACHSAIRARDRLETEEALALTDDLFRCENPWNCPHGRPTVVRIPEGKFEEWFKRRV